MHMTPVKWSVHAALTSWQSGPFALFILVLLVAIMFWYIRAEWILASRGRRWARHRTVSFAAGLLAIDLAIQSPVATFTATYFEAHVVQHLLLMIVAPPLLALGAPSTLLLQTADRRIKLFWLSVLRSRGFQLLTFPLTVWALYFGIMFAFFMSSLINTAMNHMWLMDAINLLFLFGATLYWWPLVGLDPIVHWRMGYGARMINVLLGGPPEVILGLAILSARTPIASMYSLSSTHAGGGLLWVSTEAATLLGFIPIFWQWIRADERAARRADELSLRMEERTRLEDELGVPVAVAGSPDEGMPLVAGQSLNRDWEAYWMQRTGRVPGARTWVPNRPGGR
jgi:putative copper resistance protein D